ncbi:MAG: TIGR01906 family membrane protein [Dehalococcoidia bacterium]
MGLVRYVAAFLFVIALPIAIITTNVRIVVNEPHTYSYAIDHYDGPKTTGISRDQLIDGSAELRDYFNNDQRDLFVRVNQDGQSASLFNARESAHLRDVKTLFQQSFRVQEASVIFILAYIVAVFIWAREGTMRTLAKQVLISSALALAVLAIGGAIAASGFDQSFDQFHQIAFDNDLWQLDPTQDHLIQMFPEQFWQDLTLWVGLGSMAELGVFAIGSAIYLGLTRKSPFRFSFAAGAPA